MKKIGFIGAYDKTDLILYVAKLLTELGKKILVIDATVLQKARYIVPAIAPSKCYVTEYENIDIAIGFDNTKDITAYLGTDNIKYDFVLIDIDHNKMFERFDMIKANKNYFITGFDSYSLKRGLEIMGKMPDKVTMTKVLFSRDMLQEEEDYLNFLSFYYSVQWEENKICFPTESGDESIIIENQRSARIKFKELTPEYREGLFYLTTGICPEAKQNDVKKILKNI